MGNFGYFCSKKDSMKKKFDNTDNILGGIVKKVRQEKGLSQEALGEYVGWAKAASVDREWQDQYFYR